MTSAKLTATHSTSQTTPLCCMGSSKQTSGALNNRTNALRIFLPLWILCPPRYNISGHVQCSPPMYRATTFSCWCPTVFSWCPFHFFPPAPQTSWVCHWSHGGPLKRGGMLPLYVPQRMNHTGLMAFPQARPWSLQCLFIWLAQKRRPQTRLHSMHVDIMRYKYIHISVMWNKVWP